MRLTSPRPLATLLRSVLHQRKYISDLRAFAPGDLVLLRQKKDRDAPPILTRPLQEEKQIQTHRGNISHDDIIGKRVRDVVKSKTTRSTHQGTEYRLYEVTLADYVRLSKRLVTPIYPADANLIVSLLDLHPTGYGDAGADEKLEILEAGTGHGALTLYLSRAIHAANVGIPPSENSEQWKSQRRAIIHTIDRSAEFSAHAEAVVKGFRHGIYAQNVDFHVGDVSSSLESLRASRGDEPFLSHAILDMPAADVHLKAVAEALRVGGSLIVFNPSITQIATCATRVKDEQILLELETVLEFGVNGGCGGRDWDLRFVRPRSKQPAKEAEQVDCLSESSSEDDAVDGSEFQLREPSRDREQGWSMVCRPRVGERITGGGFLGIWKKQRDIRPVSEPVSEHDAET